MAKILEIHKKLRREDDTTEDVEFLAVNAINAGNVELAQEFLKMMKEQVRTYNS